VLALITAYVATGISKKWINKTNRQFKLIPDQTNSNHNSALPKKTQYKKTISLKKIEQILDIKNIPGVNQLEKIKQIYITKTL
jgi:hypothetical protein